jgi:hypothetical protein
LANKNIEFPSDLDGDQLEHAKSQLAVVLQKTAQTLLAQRDEMLEVQYFNEFVRVISSTAELLADANQKWSALSEAAGGPIR